MTGKKTDNHNLAVKLRLRRHFLQKYHADSAIDVLDCCQGSGVIWGKLRQEFAVTSYWGLDVKPKKGRLKLDSVRVLAQPGWRQNVIDIDTYGSPWNHWLAMLPNVRQPTTVFLTAGQIVLGGSPLCNAARDALGIGTLNIPNAISSKLNILATRWLLAKGRLIEAIEAVSNGSARYLGIRLEPNRP